jgi:peptide deformylase
VSYKDEQGKPRKLQANGLLARVIQHEMDHLNGVMFVDRVDNDLALNEELKKTRFFRASGETRRESDKIKALVN